MRLRLAEKKPVPALQVLPLPPGHPDAPAAGTPPPVPQARPPQTDLPHNGGKFLAPEEVDIEEGFKKQESLEADTEKPWLGCLGGALAALAGTVVAGGFAALTGRWFGILSVGIGFAVAFGVRKLGKGNSPQFGLIGATWSLLGCLGAYHLATAIVMARVDGVSLWSFISGLESWGSFMQQVLGPKDFVFYAVAGYFGYKYSYDAVADQY